MTLAAALTAPTAGLAQVTVRKNGTDLSDSRVKVLYDSTFRVVAEEFQLHASSEIQVPVTLVLGEGRDGVVGDETEQVFTIYMSRWDEAMFATAVSRIAIQHLVSQDRKARIVDESLRRAHRVTPISKDALQAASVGPATALNSPGTLVNPLRPCFSPTASLYRAGREDRAPGRSASFCVAADKFGP